MNKKLRLNLSFYTLSELHFILSSVEKEIHERLLTRSDLAEVAQAISDHGLTLEDFLPHLHVHPKSFDSLDLESSLQLDVKKHTREKPNLEIK